MFITMKTEAPVSEQQRKMADTAQATDKKYQRL